MSIENPIIVVKKYKIREGRVIEGTPPEDSINEGIKVCQNLNKMAILETGIEAVHYLGERGVVDYRIERS